MSYAILHVRQSFASSCGPACVAMIAKVSEAEAIESIFGWEQRRALACDWPMLKAGLLDRGVRFNGGAKRCSTWEKIAGLAIVGVGRSKSPVGPVTHFVVFDADAQMVYDPKKPGPTPPEKVRRRPVSYLSIARRLGERHLKASEHI